MGHEFIALNHYGVDFNSDQLLERATAFNDLIQKRRTVRDFSNKPVPIEVMEQIIDAASSAPSGAHKQPWKFCLISNPEVKKQIREAAEKEEYENYHGRMSEEWLKDLEPFNTDWNKEFLEIAPYLIVIFKESYSVDANGEKSKNYYVNESVGIAAGFLISAIHQAGLVSLTHTPSPMNFLAELLNRPRHEKAFLLIPVGYPRKDAQIPVLKRKALDEVLIKFS
ncbi:MAG: nitroreductase family protein [Bacteroidia bacterium]